MKNDIPHLDQLKMLINEFNRLKDLVSKVSASSEKSRELKRQLDEISQRIDALTKGC